MPYVSRTKNGGINGLFANLQPGYAEEYLPDDAAEVLAFLNPPPPVPAEISDRQFFQQLAVAGIITPTEAIAAVSTGTIPAALKALVDQLPADQMFGAVMLLSGAVSFSRAHPLTAAIGAAYGMTSDQIDVLWSAASQL